MIGDKQVFLKGGYKYQLDRDFHIKTSIRPPCKIETPYIVLLTDGWLTVKKGYAHDGASGPTIDTKSTYRAATMHDPVYQLLRMGLLDQKWRTVADEDFGLMMKEDLAWWEPKLRADLWVRELKKFGGSAADPANIKVAFAAP